MVVMKALGVVLLATLDLCVQAVNPGIKLRVTDKALNYVNYVAMDYLKENVSKMKISDITGSTSGVKYDLSSIHVTGLTPPAGNLSVIQGKGVQWTGNGASVNLDGHFHISWEFISDSGSFSLSLSSMALTIGVSVDSDTNGRPKLGSATCAASIGGVHIDFHGGASVIYNLFASEIESDIKGTIQGQICKVASTALNDNVDKMLATIPVNVTIASTFIFDLHLLQAPLFTDGYMETWHKGEFYWKNDVKESPMVPLAMSMPATSQNMLHLWVSDYVINTLGYAGQTHGILKYNLTENDLPPSSRGVLNTTCSSLECIGRLIPKLKDDYPNSKVELHMQGEGVPTLSVSSTGLSAEFGGLLDVFVRMPNDSVAYAATINASAHVIGDVTLSNDTVHWTVQTPELKLTVLKSNIGQISDVALQFVTDEVLKIYLTPLLNGLGTKGIHLPVIEGVQFVDTKLTLMQDSILLSTDVHYSKVASTKKGDDSKPISSLFG